MKKYLVLYYSQTGATESVANVIQEYLGADIEKIDVTEPYSGSFAETIARVQQDNGAIPELVPISSKIEQYDVIFLGYPIWFGTYAPPIAALLNSCDFSGKTIVPFCTFGSGGIDESTAHLTAALPNSVVTSGYGVRNARIASAPAELKRFLTESGYLEGTVAPLADFSEQKEMTEEENAIFHAACDSYDMPLGTPVSVGSRPVENGMEYKYMVQSVGMDGTSATSTIYVVSLNGSEPEFTKVVR
ncbi:MAG: NAD(P)H-dependent oxidoreductase [Bacteroidales bacterium]|nr:NAD(P)H-dependent oxidoreductase [Bacteroidales bacterium]